MKFYIDFSGWSAIEAKTEEEAREKFWDMMCNGTTQTTIDIENVEEADDE